MFIVTNCTPEGNYTPSVFKNKDEAMQYKFALAVINAQKSSLGDNFEEEYGEEYGVKLETLCERLEDEIDKPEIAYELSADELDTLSNFIKFLKENGCNFTDKGAYINYSDDSYNYIEVFDVQY